MLRDGVEQEGYAIIPDAIEIDRLAGVADDLARADDKRSRAGIRHAMAFESVAKIAHDPKILKIAQQILGVMHFHFARPFLINHRSRTGLLRGIRTPRCPSGDDTSSRVGEHGLSKMA